MGNYSKLIGSVAGAVVGLIFSWLAAKGLGSCTGEGELATCTVFGLDQATATLTITSILSTIFVYVFPANKV